MQPGESQPVSRVPLAAVLAPTSVLPWLPSLVDWKCRWKRVLFSLGCLGRNVSAQPQKVNSSVGQLLEAKRLVLACCFGAESSRSGSSIDPASGEGLMADGIM